MEVMRSVLIKECNGSSKGDMVVYIDNLPKNLLYQKVKKMIIDPNDPQQRMVPEYVIQDGRKVFTGAMTDELLPGIEESRNGDESYVFFTQYNEAKDRLADIDRYVRNNVPVAERVQQRIHYAMQPGVMTSGPIPLNTIPHIVLPAPVSPPASAVQEGNTISGSLNVPLKKEKKPMTEEQRQAAKERMAHAREVARVKKAGELPK